MMLGRIDIPRWPATIAIGAIATLLGVLAVVSPTMALSVAIGLAFIAVILGDVMVGLALFAFVAFLEIPGPAGITVAKAAGVALLGSWFAWTVTRRDGRRDFFSLYPVVSYLILLFLAWAAASALWAKDSAEVLAAVTRYAPNALLLPIAVTAIRDRRGVLAVCGLFVAGALTSMLIGLVLGPGATTGKAVIGDAGGRLSGAGVDPNELAMMLVGAATLAAGMSAMRTLAPLARIVAACAGLACVLGVLMTGSRGGLIGLGAVIVLGTIFAGRGRRAPLCVVGVLAALAATMYIVALAPQTTRDRITRSDGGSGRADIWAVGWRMVRANPVQGVGAGNFTNTSVDYLLQPGYLARDTYILANPKVAHNIYLQVLAELGIVGLILFLSIIGFALTCAAKAARMFDARGDPALEIAARSVVVGVVSMLVASTFVSQEFNKPLWVLIALGPALLALARQSDRAAPAAASARAHLRVGARV